MESFSVAVTVTVAVIVVAFVGFVVLLRRYVSSDFLNSSGKRLDPVDSFAFQMNSLHFGNLAFKRLN